MIIRSLQQKDLPQAKEIWQECFDDLPAFVDWYFSRRFRPEEALGIFSGSRLLCNLHLVPYRLRLRGWTFPSAYLVGLATREAYRRQGLAKKLLTFTLRFLREKGIFFTFLMPFQIPFYTHLGWGICARHRLYRFPPETGGPPQNGPGGQEMPGKVERETSPASPEPAVFDRIYRRWSAGLDGCLLRTEEDWQGLLFDHFLEKGEVWFVKDKEGVTLAYALFRPGTKESVLREAAYLTPPAGYRLLQHLRAATGKPLVWTAPDQEMPFPSLPVAKVKPVFLGRITDLRAALEFPLYPPGIKGTWRLRVHDPLLQENNGVFLLEAEGDGRMHVTPAPGEEANLACGIGGLARLLSGTVSPEEAGKNPFLTGDGKLVSSFLRLFPKSGLYINDYF